MPGPMVTIAATVLCAHGGKGLLTPTQPRVLAMGQPVVLAPPPVPIVACVFTLPGPVPAPCLTAQWTVPSVRVLVTGQPIALAPGPAICAGGGPPLPATVAPSQTRVIAS
jgi:hypothetical protein